MDPNISSTVQQATVTDEMMLAGVDFRVPTTAAFNALKATQEGYGIGRSTLIDGTVVTDSQTGNQWQWDSTAATFRSPTIIQTNVLPVRGLSAANTGAQNSSALTAAFNAMGSGGGTLVLPAISGMLLDPWTVPDARPLRIVGQGIGAYQDYSSYDPHQGSATEFLCTSANSPAFTLDKGFGTELHGFAIIPNTGLTPVSGSTALLIGNGSSGSAGRGGSNFKISRMAFVKFYNLVTKLNGRYMDISQCHFVAGVNNFLMLANATSLDESDDFVTDNKFYAMTDIAASANAYILWTSGGGLRISRNKFNVIAGLAQSKWPHAHVIIDSSLGATSQVFIDGNSCDAFKDYAVLLTATANGIADYTITHNLFASYANGSGANIGVYNNASIGAIGVLAFANNISNGCQSLVSNHGNSISVGPNISVNCPAGKPIYDFDSTGALSYVPPTMYANGDDANSLSGAGSLFCMLNTRYPRRWCQDITHRYSWGSGPNGSVSSAATNIIAKLYFWTSQQAQIDLNIEAVQWGSDVGLCASLSRLVTMGRNGTTGGNDVGISTVGTDTARHMSLTGAAGSGTTQAVFISAGSGSMSNGTTKGLSHPASNAATQDNIPVISTGSAGSGEGIKVSFNSKMGSTNIGQINTTFMELTIEITGITATGWMVNADINIKGNPAGFELGSYL